MRQLVIPILLLMLLCFHCSAPTSTSSMFEREQSSQSATSTSTNDQTKQTFSEFAVMDDSLSRTLRQHCSLWLNSWERSLRTDSFAFVRNYTSPLPANWEKFDISDQHFSDYRDKIYYSPNGSYALDLYSYNLIINRKNDKIYAELDLDIQVYVIDIPRHQRHPILFVGPSESIDDGYWLSDSTVVLVGWEMCYDCPKEAYIPVVRKVNVFTGETVEYDYNVAFPHYNSGFLQQKFPEIIFD